MEQRRERLGGPHKDARVDTNGRKGRAKFDATSRKCGGGCQDASGLAARANSPDGIFDDHLDLRMARFANVAEARRQIGRADEHTIDTVD